MATLAGVLLIGPILIRGLARCAGRLPIAGRLALRDLGRYQARSGAALAAIALAIGIPVAIVAATAAADNNLGPGNLSSTQLLIRPSDVDGPFVHDASTVAAMQPGVDAIAAVLNDPTVIPLDVAFNPDLPPRQGANGSEAVSIAHRIDRGFADGGLMYVASPEILAQYGLTPAEVGSNYDIITNHSGDDLVIIDLSPKRANRNEFEHVDAPNSLPETYGSLPHALVNPNRLAERGWQSVPSGRWLIQTAQPLTSDRARNGSCDRRAARLHDRESRQPTVTRQRSPRRRGRGHAARARHPGDDGRADPQRERWRTAYAHRHGSHELDEAQHHGDDRRWTGRPRMRPRHHRCVPRVGRGPHQQPHASPEARPGDHRDRHSIRGRRRRLAAGRARARSIGTTPHRLRPAAV